MTSRQPHNYFTLHKRYFELKHKHYCYGNLSHLVRYVFLVIVGLGYKFDVFTHSYKLPDNYSYVFSQHSCPMLQRRSIKKAIFRGANFGAYTDPSFHWNVNRNLNLFSQQNACKISSAKLRHPVLVSLWLSVTHPFIYNVYRLIIWWDQSGDIIYGVRVCLENKSHTVCCHGNDMGYILYACLPSSNHQATVWHLCMGVDTMPEVWFLLFRIIQRPKTHLWLYCQGIILPWQPW